MTKYRQYNQAISSQTMAAKANREVRITKQSVLC